jgi:hypothetical protein
VGDRAALSAPGPLAADRESAGVLATISAAPLRWFVSVTGGGESEVAAADGALACPFCSHHQ